MGHPSFVAEYRTSMESKSKTPPSRKMRETGGATSACDIPTSRKCGEKWGTPSVVADPEHCGCRIPKRPIILFILDGMGEYMLKMKVVAVVVVTLVASLGLAQEHEHGTGEKLGRVHFVTSCNAAAENDFDRAVALLHSFQFSRAIEGFHAAL